MKVPNFVRDLSKSADLGMLQPAISRDEEISAITRILSAPEKPNCALLGPPGSGKTAIVEGLAYQIRADGSFPFRIFVVDLPSLNAGTMYRGMIEERTKELLEFGSSNRNIVLFIDEFHMLAGLGRASESGASSDVSQILKPALARGTIRCIGATTEEEFTTYLQPDAAMIRRFQVVRVKSLLGTKLESVINAKLTDLGARLQLSFPPETCAWIMAAAESLFPARAEPDRSLDIVRKISSNHGDRINLRICEQLPLGQSLGILDYQMKQIQSGDLLGAATAAKKWLGIADVQNKILEKTDIDDAIESLRSNVR